MFSNNLLMAAAGGGPAGPASAAWEGGEYSTSSGTTWTKSDQWIGAASSDRVVVILTYSYVDTIGVTIGGNAMTELGQANLVESTLNMFALAYPSGTTATFVVTSTSSTTMRAMHIYKLTGTGGSTTVSDIATYAGPNAGGSQQIASVSLDVPENGTVIAASFNQAYSSDGVWTGIDKDERINPTGNQFWEGASKDFESASVGLNITRTWDTGQRVGMIAAAWGPP